VNEEPVSPTPRSAWRLFLAFNGEDIQPTTYYAVEMLVPPSDSLESLEGHSGAWFQLDDASGKPLYRRIVYDLFGALPDLLHEDDPPIESTEEHYPTDSVEGHYPVEKSSQPTAPQETGAPALSVETPPQTGVFTLLLPVLEEAVWLSIYSSPPTLERLTYPAERIARFSLEEIQHMQEE
jgi:hypothetical protein